MHTINKTLTLSRSLSLSYGNQSNDLLCIDLLAGEDLISVLFFYNSEPRPDTMVIGLSSKGIVSLLAEDLKQRTKT